MKILRIVMIFIEGVLGLIGCVVLFLGACISAFGIFMSSQGWDFRLIILVIGIVIVCLSEFFVNWFYNKIMENLYLLRLEKDNKNS